MDTPNETKTFVDVDFEEGFKRGEDMIRKVRLRRPGGGEMRGLSIMEVRRQDYTTIETLAPRITEPPMTRADVAALSAADLAQLGVDIALFFVSRKDKAEAGLID